MDPTIWGFVRVVLGGVVAGFFTNRGERIRAQKEAALDGAKRQDDDVSPATTFSARRS